MRGIPITNKRILGLRIHGAEHPLNAFINPPFYIYRILKGLIIIPCAHIHILQQHDRVTT